MLARVSKAKNWKQLDLSPRMFFCDKACTSKRLSAVVRIKTSTRCAVTSYSSLQRGSKMRSFNNQP